MIFSHLLYIFQSEHYDRMRFLKFAYSHVFSWHKLSDRGSIDWTLRAKILMFLSVSFFVIDFFIFRFFIEITPENFLFLSAFIISGILFFPIYLVLADVIFSPLLHYKKQKIFTQAEKILGKYKKRKLQVIGITGSFGKTSLKNILTKIMETQFSVMTIPGNINTDLGVANYLIAHESELENSDFLVVEMGAFTTGEIQSICDVVHPEYSFLTAIAPVHLERFGSIENTAKAKFELPNSTSKITYLNNRNKNIQKFFQQYAAGAPIYRAHDLCGRDKSTPLLIENICFLPEFSGISFVYKNTEFSTKLISEYIFEFFEMIFPFAENLKISPENIQKGIANIDYTPHRLQVIKNKNTGVTVIDDSYNGNFSGFQAGLKTLSRASGRKIVLTPGIVELGDLSEKIHKKLAKVYLEEVDLLLLIENSNTRIIQKFLDTNTSEISGKKRTYTMYSDVHTAHADLGNIVKKGDTILFQNDLSDNY